MSVAVRAIVLLMVLMAPVERVLAAAPPSAENPVALILGRPLFAVDRRPVDAPSEEDSMPVLTGLVQGKGERAALFRPQNADEAGEPVPVGGEILGWTVMAVERDAVVISRDGKTLTLHPDYRNAAPPS